MDKIDKILNLISEKSELLYEEYGDISIDEDNHRERSTECLAQVTILNELYNEVKLIKAEDV